MTGSSSAQDPGRSQTVFPYRPSRLSHRSIPAFAGEGISAKLYSVGLQAAVTVLLSVFGLGSAMGQSIDQDMVLGANTQANRDRVISEIRQARVDGTIKRWSPVLLEVPSRTSRKGIRFAPFSPQEPEGGAVTFPRPQSGIAARDPTSVAPGAAE
jgi:hypothetical protein